MKAKKDGVSLFLSIVTHAAAIITILCLLFIIAYILIRGIPNLTPSLFEWEYTTDNVSMMPSIINIVDCRADWDLFSHLSGGICQTWFQTGEGNLVDDRNLIRYSQHRLWSVWIIDVCDFHGYGSKCICRFFNFGDHGASYNYANNAGGAGCSTGFLS